MRKILVALFALAFVFTTSTPANASLPDDPGYECC